MGQILRKDSKDSIIVCGYVSNDNTGNKNICRNEKTIGRKQKQKLVFSFIRLMVVVVWGKW